MNQAVFRQARVSPIDKALFILSERDFAYVPRLRRVRARVACQAAVTALVWLSAVVEQVQGADLQLVTPTAAKLLRISAPDTGISLDWAEAGPDLAYTVEAVNSLTEVGGWSSAAASVWPVNAHSWTEPGLRQGTARFYRIVTSPARADRGKLLQVAPLPSVSPAEILAMFAQIGIPLTPGTGVRQFKLIYETINPFNLRTSASGLIVLPEAPERALPLASYEHGTIPSRPEVPSRMQGLERIIGIALGTSGYAAVLPDYLGLGDSPGLHPFVHAKSLATVTVDLLRAARTFCASNSIALNGQILLIGYSEGGYATMAAHREIETFHTNEFTVTASAPMAGPYDLSGVMVDDFFSGRPMPNPYYFLFLLATYQSIYHVAGSLAEMLASPYDSTLPPLLDGQHDGAAINRAIGTSNPMEILKPEFLATFKTNPNHPMRLALRENDLYDWTPKAPLHLYHCDADQDVIYANSQVAFDSFQRRGAADVQLINPYPSADHATCAPIALLAAKFVWFDSLVQK